MAAINTLVVFTVLAALFMVVKADDCKLECTRVDAKTLFDCMDKCQGAKNCTGVTDQTEVCMTCIHGWLCDAPNPNIDCLMETSGFKDDCTLGKKFVDLVTTHCQTHLIAEAASRGIKG